MLAVVALVISLQFMIQVVVSRSKLKLGGHSQKVALLAALLVTESGTRLHERLHLLSNVNS